MATMIAYTAIDLPAEQKRALCVGVEKRASEAFQIDIFCVHRPQQDGRSKTPAGQKYLRRHGCRHRPSIKEHASNNVGVDAKKNGTFQV